MSCGSTLFQPVRSLVLPALRVLLVVWELLNILMIQVTDGHGREASDHEDNAVKNIHGFKVLELFESLL